MATPPVTDSDDMPSESREPPHEPHSTGPLGPVRILVQTRTQFVPGQDKDYWERIRLMRNLICQHVWNRDYDGSRERARHRGCEFAYDNRDCWFLVDYPFTSAEPATQPPVLWYKWTSTSFIQLSGPLPLMVLEEVQRYRFTKVEGTFMPPAQVGPHIRKKMLRDALDCNRPLTMVDIDFVREHPGHAKWVKQRVEDRAWQRLEELVEWAEREEREREERDEWPRSTGSASENSDM